ncbi:pali-domain-containing protein [Mycena epipterygia]|nr:pali-domain-containing protein [Mycena epipterygia]
MFALHIGTFLIFSALVLLIVASISAPTVAKIDFLHVAVANGSSVNFGSLGFCIQMADGNSCTPTGVGYRIADEIAAIGINPFSGVKAASLHGLTEGLILHQIAAGITGIAFLLAVCSHRLGYLFASAVAFIAFLFSLAVLIIDFIVFGSVKDHVNKNDGSATFGNAIWMVLAATIVLFFASIATCFACVTARRHRRSTKTAAAY